jgi:hypothetical protein
MARVPFLRLKTIFCDFQIKILEGRTGARIDLQFGYEECRFTKENCKIVITVLQKKRGKRSRPVQVTVEHIEKADGTNICRIFNKPYPKKQPCHGETGTSNFELEQDDGNVDASVPVSVSDEEYNKPGTSSSTFGFPQLSPEIICNSSYPVSSIPNAGTLKGVAVAEVRSPSPVLAKDSTDNEAEGTFSGMNRNRILSYVY